MVSPLFPIGGEPYRGMPVYNTVLELQKLADVRVFCPIAVYPRWKRLQPVAYIYRKPDAGFQPRGVETEYIRYRALPMISRPFNGASCGRALQPALRRFAPDLILAYWVFPEGRGALLAGRKLGVPVIGSSRGTDLRRPPDRVSRALLCRTLQSMNGLVAVSDELRALAVGFGMSPERIRVIPNGCNTRVFRPGSRSEARAQLQVSPDAEVILFVGHLIPSKGLAELAQAVAALAPRRPNLRLVCVGEGVWHAEFEACLAAAGVRDRTLLAGAATPEEVARWLAAADVFCLPSHGEGCPNVVIEALACARPVVATTVGAIPQLVDNSSGILVPPRDAQALASALSSALDRTWDAGALTVHTRGWDQVARETLDFCLSVAPVRAAVR